MKISNPSLNTSDVVILVNGPGELSSYVKPTICALHRDHPQLRITLIFTPCPYSTGKEREIALSIPGVSRVINAREFIRWMLWRKKPKGIQFNRTGVVVFMGGDILYGKMIAKRINYPAVAYSEAYAKWPDIYKKILAPDRMIYEKFREQGFPENQIKIVGNLMVDSIVLKKNRKTISLENGLDPEKKIVSFLPGSREFQVRYTLDFFARTAELMNVSAKGLQFAFIISPFLPKDKLEKQLKKAGLEVRGNRIITKGTTITMISSDIHDAIAASDLIITIPGTNTAEVSIIGTPFISVFPFESCQLIPLEGIYDLIGKVPVLGFIFKNFYVKMMLLKTRFFAIPNIKSGKEIVPELNGTINTNALADKAVSILNDAKILVEMSVQLKACLGAPGAAERIAKEIYEVIP